MNEETDTYLSVPINKQEAVRTIVKNLDTLLEKSGFGKVEEKGEVTSLDEDNGEDLINGLGEIYEHKIKDCKFVVNFFPDMENSTAELGDSNDYIELNLYLNGELIRKGGGYIGELFGPFWEGFGDRVDDICFEGEPDRVSRPLPERDDYEKPVGYRERKSITGYDVSFERYLFSVDKWNLDKIPIVINDALTTLLEIVEGDIEINKKSEKKSLEKRLEYDKIVETQDVKKVIKERNEEFWKDVNERDEYFCKIGDDIHIDRMYRFIVPRDIISHIFLNAKSYNADELSFETYGKDFHVYMTKGLKKIEMLDGFPLQQKLLTLDKKEVPMGERVIEEIKLACALVFESSGYEPKATVVLYDKKYHVKKSLAKINYRESVLLKFVK